MITFNELVSVNTQVNFSVIEQWLCMVILDQKKDLDFINFVFCTDDYLLKINQDFLNHDYFTDVITFDYTNDVISSDVFISIDRVIDNATSLKINYDNELLRVILHGVLHLCGYSDKTKHQKELMRSMEEHYLKLFVSRET